MPHADDETDVQQVEVTSHLRHTADLRWPPQVGVAIQDNSNQLEMLLHLNQARSGLVLLGFTEYTDRRKKSFTSEVGDEIQSSSRQSR